jgi:hypothetical protein
MGMRPLQDLLLRHVLSLVDTPTSMETRVPASV